MPLPAAPVTMQRCDTLWTSPSAGVTPYIGLAREQDHCGCSPPCLHRLCALYGESLVCRGQGMPAAGLVGLCSACDKALQRTLRDMCLGAQIMQGERGVVAHVTLPHAHELARYDTLELDFALGCPGAFLAPS